MNLFQWKCEPEAEAVALHWLQVFVQKNPALQELDQELQEQTSTRLLDWVDHFVVPAKVRAELEKAGYVEQEGAFYHPGAQLPRFILATGEASHGVAVSVENIANFLMVRGLSIPIEGSSLSGYRRACVSDSSSAHFWVVERRGTSTFDPLYLDEAYERAYLSAVEQWKTRPRSLENEDKEMHAAQTLAQTFIEDLGQDLAAWIILEVERDYWQAKNTAGQIQKARQDRVGMGWANHDHHTFRSSRARFQPLVHLFETLGFHCRERFYAGAEAGWGAQIMENPRAKLVLFLDVDLAPEELQVDFAHESLPPLTKLGTVGLWCALHGDSILRAGMHHLEAQFLFEELKRDLKGVHMMEPFSNFPYLKQAFTEGERWRVDPSRLSLLVQQGLITSQEAEKFKLEGALGSHMENLQRREGYKGFNQKNVSTIIQKTDPRKVPKAVAS